MYVPFTYVLYVLHVQCLNCTPKSELFRDFCWLSLIILVVVVAFKTVRLHAECLLIHSAVYDFMLAVIRCIITVSLLGAWWKLAKNERNTQRKKNGWARHVHIHANAYGVYCCIQFSRRRTCYFGSDNNVLGTWSVWITYFNTC